MTHNGPKNLEQGVIKKARRLITDDENVQQFKLGIFGKPGFGKSGLALMLADDIEEGRFDPLKQVAAAKGDYEHLREVVGPHKVIIDDEATNSGALKKRAMSGVNVQRLVDANTGRKKQHALITIMPYMDDFDDSIFRHFDAILKLDRQGHGDYFDVRTKGLKRTVVWLAQRFDFDFPDCAKVRPDLWDPYMTLFDKGSVKERRLERSHRIEAYRQTLRQVMAPKPPAR